MSLFSDLPFPDTSCMQTDSMTKVFPVYRNLQSHSVDGVLCVQMPKSKSKYFLKKRLWTLRYCLLKSDELFVYKNEKGDGENVERICWNLRKAKNVKIRQNIEMQHGIGTSDRTFQKIPLRFVEIIDEFGEKFCLSFKDDDEMYFWLTPLMKIFHKIYPYADCKTKGTVAKVFSDIEQGFAILNADDGQTGPISDKEDVPTEPNPFITKPKSLITSEIEEENLKRSNESFKNMLNIQEKILNERRNELKNLLNESVSDEESKLSDIQEMSILRFSYLSSSSSKHLSSFDQKSSSISFESNLNSGGEISSVHFLPSTKQDSVPGKTSSDALRPSLGLKSYDNESSVSTNTAISSTERSLKFVEVSQKINEEVEFKPDEVKIVCEQVDIESCCNVNPTESESELEAAVNSQRSIQQNENFESFNYQKYLLSIWNRRIKKNGLGATEKESGGSEYSSKCRESYVSNTKDCKNGANIDKKSSESFCNTCFSDSSSSWAAQSYLCSFCKNRRSCNERKIESTLSSKLNGIEKFYRSKTPNSKLSSIQQISINTGAGDVPHVQTSEFVKRMKKVFEGKADSAVIKPTKSPSFRKHQATYAQTKSSSLKFVSHHQSLFLHADKVDEKCFCSL